MSIAQTIGTVVGSSAAYAKHAAISSARYTGKFGADLATSTAQGYAAKDAELRAAREAARADAPALPKKVRQTKLAA